jgi:hypothetical protein
MPETPEKIVGQIPQPPRPEPAAMRAAMKMKVAESLSLCSTDQERAMLLTGAVLGCYLGEALTIPAAIILIKEAADACGSELPAPGGAA